MKKGIKKFIGDKQFYKMALAIIIPVVIQQVILSIAGYVDNLMVNSYSQTAYAGVSTANRFMFLINFFWIGLSSGISIFITQYYGAKEKDKLTGTIQLSLIIGIVLGVVSMLLLYYAGPLLIKLFIKGDGAAELEAISHGTTYIRVIAFGAVFMLLNFMVSVIYRSLGKPKIPMFVGIIGIIINMGLNTILIFGYLGAPALGAKGAAIATVISKVVELILLIIIAIIYDKDKSIVSIFKKNYMTKNFFKLYLKKGGPIVLNEILWAVGVQILARLITGGNLAWLTAFNYSQNVTDLFFVYYAGIATGTAVLVGTALGEGDFPKAKDYANKLIGVMFVASVIAIILLVGLSPLLLMILTPVNEYYWSAYHIILVTSIFIVLYGFNAMVYYILRAGGDSIRAFLLDQLPTYLLGIPLAFLLHQMEPKWQIGLVGIFAFTKIIDVVKAFFSYILYKKETWVVNLTNLEQIPLS